MRSRSRSVASRSGTSQRFRRRRSGAATGRGDGVGVEVEIHNPELHRLYRKVDQLSDEDQRALVVVLDSLVKRSRVKRAMTE